MFQRRRRRGLALLASAAIGLAGCGGPSPFGGPEGRQRFSADRVTQQELRDLLNQYEDGFEGSIVRAADELVSRDPSRRTRKLALIWQMKMLPMARDCLDQQNPVAGFLDLWSLALRMQNYLQSGDGRTLFGQDQPIAVRAAEECTKRISEMTDLIMSPDMAASARRRVEALAAKYPLRGEFSGTQVRTVVEAGDDSALKEVLSIPLVPFRALTGVDKTAQAIREFTAVADRLTSVVEGLATDARLNLQLLLLETEDMDAVQRSVDSVERFSKSSERLAGVAEKLPSELRVELEKLLKDVEARQPELRQTLQDARATAEQLDRAGTQVARAGDALAGTARSIQEMVASFRRPAEGATTPGAHVSGQPATTQADPSRPFDILDYAKTADAVGAAAVDLHTLANDLHSIAGAQDLKDRMDDLDRRVQDLLLRTQGSAREVTDHAAVRGFQLILAAGVVALIYRLIASRWAGRGRL